MMVSASQVTYRYRSGFTLGPVSADFPAGGFNVLLGPNGSGKTTLFGLLGGWIHPAQGQVTLEGRPLKDYTPKERARRIGLVPQISERSFNYTVRQVVEMGRFPRQPLWDRGKGDETVVEEILERLDLTAFSGRRIFSLSGGEYQRVLLARVLAQEPDVLLLDEPANHLDLRHQAALLSLLHEETLRGKTVIAVLHDINQALRYGQWGLLLKEGQVVRSGDPSDFLDPRALKEVFDVELETYHSIDGDHRFYGLPGGRK